jgi:GxxExxY protein
MTWANDPVPENALSRTIIGAAIEVHKELGRPGLLEDMYEEALCAELKLRGISADRQIEVPVFYKRRRLNKNYRLDLLVENLVIVEVKSTEQHNAVLESQCLTHLRLTQKQLGLVINFGQRFLKDGIHRVVNGLKES